MTKTHLTEQKFADLGLQAEVLKGLEDKGYHNCTPIQAISLPVLLQGKDIAGQAQTGTGKTIAFLAATFHYLMTQPEPENRQLNQPRAMILAPTRELAIQIHKDALCMAKTTGLKLGLVYGGEGYESQRQQLDKGVDILIGTTGRMIDYLRQGAINMGSIQAVVLDEADRMFDLGFIKDIRFLFRRMPDPTQRLNMLFSATLSYRVKELAFEHMQEPEHVVVEPEQLTAARITEELFYPSNDHKMALLQSLLEEDWPERCIIFANTKHQCEKIWGALAADKHRVGLLNGDVAQKKRLQILDQFTKGNLDVLVATDVAARGLHIPSVTHVYNFDLPDDAEDYVHRIGRTGRAGASGKAISLACEEYAFNLPAIEEYIRHPLPVSNYKSELLLKDLPEPIRMRKNKSHNQDSFKKRHGKPGQNKPRRQPSHKPA